MLVMRLVARFFLVGLLLATFACTMWGPKKNLSWKSATASEDMERLFWRDVQKKDWKSIQAHLAATMTATSPQGAMNKDQLMSHLQLMEISDYQLGEFSSQPNGPDLVVTYVISIKGTVGGHKLPQNPIRMMSVWQEAAGKWIMIAHSTHPTPE